ncbi:MAG TPA: sigma-70 family RNA polymerase sigma factor [Pyrinomonadaceae bacterium]|nr:sigma-70 family RNA polymerase sigma factor [Pyrinomonadaceae bacterium]
MHTSDAELLRAVASGDSQALAELYDRYHSILFGLLLRILRDGAEAEDVLQEVFIQAWRRASKFDESRGKAFTWLVTIARSRAIDRLRSLSAAERASLRAAPDPWQEVSDASTDAVRSEESERVRRALSEIPEEQREALLLAYFEGLSQTEIAEKTETPLGTIKTRTRAGLKRLRELLRK